MIISIWHTPWMECWSSPAAPPRKLLSAVLFLVLLLCSVQLFNDSCHGYNNIILGTCKTIFFKLRAI